MKKWFKIGTVAALVAMVALMAVGTGAAFAQGPVTSPPLAGSGLRIGGPQNSLVAIAAKTLGMDQTALVAELRAGKTIADVAKTKNVAVSKIVDAMVANRTAALKAAVDASGLSTTRRITQAQMDAELAALKQNVTTRISSKWSAFSGQRQSQTQTPGQFQGRGRGRGMGQGLIDANKDGVCDNCRLAPQSGTTTNPTQSFGQGRGQGMGPGFAAPPSGTTTTPAQPLGRGGRWNR